MGFLMKEIPDRRGSNQNIAEDDRPKVLTRTEVAREAGISQRQQKMAFRGGPSGDRLLLGNRIGSKNESDRRPEGRRFELRPSSEELAPKLEAPHRL